jgi:deoxyribodipyrimidine photo-lyase
MVHEARIRHLIGSPPRKGGYILYWMQQAQRTEFNHALSFAMKQADALEIPLVVGFVLIPDFPEANIRHYRFMLEGIEEVRKRLEHLDIAFVLRIGEMVSEVMKLAEGAAWVVTDVGYLRVQRKWRKDAAEALTCPFTLVETDVVVPAEASSAKLETAARTFRPKVLERSDEFLDAVPLEHARRPIYELPEGCTGQIDIEELLSKISCDRSASPVSAFKGGEQAARIRLNRFMEEMLPDYEALSRDPGTQCQSDMSPYLHFGQISPVAVYREVRSADVPEGTRRAFLEQILVRRELSVNFVRNVPGYDRYEEAVPGWARQSLEKHLGDFRPFLYTREQFEAADTHDPYWNAAQREMLVTGKMHGYMRMYWGKKIIEWTPDPETAFSVMLELNNRYELDGRDPNSYAGVAWCFGRHDRPFQEREVYGKIRYMNARGLERKFRIKEYVDRINALSS